MRTLLLAASLALLGAPCFAQAGTTDGTGPREVGTTTMPAGQYYITEQTTQKSYSLTVTDKGNMILGPAPDGIEVKTAATTNTTTSTTTTVGNSESAMKGLMKQGMEKGMSEMVKQAGEKELGNFMK